MKVTDDRRAYTRQEAADLYGVHYTTIEKAIRKGALKAKRLGRKDLISADALREWFDGLADS